MRKILLAAVLISCATAAVAESTIDPTIPADHAPLTSSAMRQQFLRAFNDIHGIENCFEGVTAPGTPLRGQCWLDTSASATVQTLKRYDGAQWVIEGVLDTVNHAFFPGGSATVDTNAALALVPTSIGKAVRLGFTVRGDHPPLQFTALTGNCATNSLVNDGGSCSNATDGGSWKAASDGIYDVRWWGAKVDGATDDSAAQIAANTAIERLGGGTLTIPATGACMYGQGFIVGAGVKVAGPSMWGCAKLKANATLPLFQTANAYLYMQRQVTGTVTQATTSVPVSDIDGVINAGAIFVMDDTGVAHTCVVNGAPSGSAIPCNAATWTGGSFTASAGSWWGDLNHVGPANPQWEDLFLDLNSANQPLTNSLVAAVQTVGAGSNLTLVGGTPTAPTPYANHPVEFGSTSNDSAATLTVTCDFVRQDLTSVSVSRVLVGGPNNSRVVTSDGCHKITQIAVSGATATNITVGWADGPLSQDGIVVYAAQPRIRNVYVQNARGWCFRTGFVPGTGFSAASPSGNLVQTQEGYFENLQCLSGTSAFWYDGPNDSRLKSLTANFLRETGLWYGRWCGGCNADHVHVSGGNDGTAVREPLWGMVSDADTTSCVECKFEEAVVANVLLRANSPVLEAGQVFHVDDTVTNRVGIQIGHSDYNLGRLVTGYRLILEGKELGGGAVKFVADGGKGSIDGIVFNDGVFTGDLPYNGTPLDCGSGGSFIRLLDGVTLANSVNRGGPCPSVALLMKFNGVAPAQTVVGRVQGDKVNGEITLNASPGTGAVTVTGFPAQFQPIGTCPVVVSFATASSLTGTVTAFLQGGTMTVNQWAAAGTAAISETGSPTPFVNGSIFYFTAGPCIQ